MDLIENLDDMDTSFFCFFFNYDINNVDLCILQAVSYASQRLLDFRTELVNLMIRQIKYRKQSVVPQSLSHSIRDSVLTVCSFCRVGEVGISREKCHPLFDVGRHPVHHTTFSCSFCKVHLCTIPCFAGTQRN